MAEKVRIKAILHGPPTCECAISYGLYSDNIADPQASELRPERITKLCAGHKRVYSVVMLDAIFRRETDLVLDTTKRVVFSGAKLSICGWDKDRRLVVVISGASQSLKDDLERFEKVVPTYVDAA